jgi:hypothetical protein
MDTTIDGINVTSVIMDANSKHRLYFYPSDDVRALVGYALHVGYSKGYDDAKSLRTEDKVHCSQGTNIGDSQ